MLSFPNIYTGFMLDNHLLTTIGSLIGVSGSILSYIMVRFSDASMHLWFLTLNILAVRRNEQDSYKRLVWRYWRTCSRV